jgi:hypothetical protein
MEFMSKNPVSLRTKIESLEFPASNSIHVTGDPTVEGWKNGEG